MEGGVESEETEARESSYPVGRGDGERRDGGLLEEVSSTAVLQVEYCEGSPPTRPR